MRRRVGLDAAAIGHEGTRATVSAPFWRVLPCEFLCLEYFTVAPTLLIRKDERRGVPEGNGKPVRSYCSNEMRRKTNP
jgi:hypothetical protein